jgi:superfamily II DNA or RNA helicase
MARLSTSHPDVRTLVDDLLVPGYIATGTLSGLTRAIAALADAPAGQPHPARIAALLSDDPGKGINDSTLSLLKRAAERNPWIDDPAVGRGLADVAETARPHAAAGLEPAQISELVSYPAAVIRVALPPAAITPPDVPDGDKPDWSFQDVAVENCLALLRRRPARNVGLVLPTGAGKTRTALRVILEMLEKAEPDARAVWVTHRHLLREQAARELAKLVETPPPGLPDTAQDLADRIDIVMVGDLPAALGDDAARLALIVVDEGHHAAAASYEPVFSRRRKAPVLLLTATPIRTDRKPIHIDDVAYTVTYRELARRNAILIPTFEPLPVDTFEMTKDTIKAIARTVADETAKRFRKTLVVASRVEHVEALSKAIAEEIEARPDHPMRGTDVGYIHGTSNSHQIGDEAMLALFGKKPRAVLVSAQMLLEGFDDPSIDSVVITYRTASVITLMQAAGRCVRRFPGKRQAWVLQVDNPQLAYRFDERWLYQEISDRVRPRIEDVEYASVRELVDQARVMMDRYNVNATHAARVIDELSAIDPADSPRLLFYGLPYFESPDRFEQDAEWGVFLETKANTAVFRNAFNQYCAITPDAPDPVEFLKSNGRALGLPEGKTRLRRDLTAVLSATYFARRETDEVGGAAQERRGYTPHGATTWLRYVVFKCKFDLPSKLSMFLADCHNGNAVAAEILDDPDEHVLVIKVAMPIGGHEAVLLDAPSAEALVNWLNTLEAMLRSVEPSRQLARMASLLSELPAPPLAPVHLTRCEPLIAQAGRKRLAFDLKTSKE